MKLEKLIVASVLAASLLSGQAKGQEGFHPNESPIYSPASPTHPANPLFYPNHGPGLEINKNMSNKQIAYYTILGTLFSIGVTYLVTKQPKQKNN